MKEINMKEAPRKEVEIEKEENEGDEVEIKPRSTKYDQNLTFVEFLEFLLRLFKNIYSDINPNMS